MAFKIFEQIQLTRPKSNTFDLSHDHKLSLNMGKLVPIYCVETIPGDRHSISAESLIRFAPLIAPVMHKVDVYMHFFFVPNRIIWPSWEKFITGNDDTVAAPFFQGTDGSPFPVEKGDIHDYLGLPLSSNLRAKVSALPWGAYQKVFKDYYCDQNVDPIALADFALFDGNCNAFISPADGRKLRNRAWEHDYFTSALPWAQKGTPVNIPLSLSGQADLSRKVDNLPDQLTDVNGNPIPSATALETDTNAFITADGTPAQINLQNWQTDLEGQGQLNGTINDLRRAFSLQKWLEKNARAGTRYVESILAHFGVRSSDARLQRPEYIGGSKQHVVISEVLQTSQTDTAGTPQANMAGHAVSVGSGNTFSYFSEEHGHIIGIMSILPKTAYQQGIPKSFTRFDKLDYYWPDFAHIGEQEILNKELYYVDSDPDNEAVFGYIPRYAEYRYTPSRVSGEFRTNLDFWHMGRVFQTRPLLNQEFIYSDPTKRIFAVQDPDIDNIYAHVFVRNMAKRPIPLFGTPLGL